ncbi:glycosyltransferase family 4 protein [bacterium]|nr:glycosyltransferase family 4 protein [bacterium]
MANVALVDLLFHWPPTGGSWVDLVQIARRLLADGHRVRLFCPRMTRYFPRGQYRDFPTLAVETLPVSPSRYRPRVLGPRLRAALDRFAPHLVFFGDGYHMKPALLPYLSHHPTIVRFYAHEVVCVNVRHYLFREGKVCPDGNFLTDPARCHRCYFPGALDVLKHRAAIALGLPDRRWALHLSHEYLYSGAGTAAYRRDLVGWLRQARELIVYNAAQAERLSGIGVPVHCVPSGVVTKRFAGVPLPEVKSDRPLRVLLAGRAEDPLKGLSVLLAAAEELQRRGIAVEVHAGGDVARRPGLVVVPWRRPEELASLYAGVDLVVAASLWEEPFGIAAVEAMAAGRPVVASNLGGLSEIVADGETGALVPAGDAIALADAIAVYAADRALLAEHGLCARQRATGLFDWERVWGERLAPILAPYLA